MDVKKVIESYLDKSDWRVNENSNAAPTIGALTKHAAGQAFSEYWRSQVYDPVNPEITKAHDSGHFHIHDLSAGLTLYCCGYSLETILREGIHGIPNVSRSSPPKHIDSAFAQIVNLTTTFQNEIAGAVAYSSVDTRLAPYIKKDGLNEVQVLQEIQRFVYALNSNSRCGAEPAFTNITLDLTVPADMKDQHPVIAGETMSFTYGDCQEQLDMFNRAFLRVCIEGDYNHRPFSYPIPTYNITKDFDWNSPIADLLFELAGKYGVPYFANYINSDMDPSEARSMCCRLRLDLRELTRRNGGLFGSGDSTGSVGVVTINLPRLAYEAVHSKKTDKSAMDLFYESLYKYMDLAKESLIIKRDYLEREILSKHLLPAFETYVGTMNNHFSTIGLIGMNEMCQNLIGVGIHSSLGKQLSLEVLDAMRERLSDYQEETGDLWNLEATPAEATCVIGDTLIQTTEGNVPIKELVGRDDVHVICYDTHTNKLRIKKAYDIRKTGSNKSVVRVTFDNGQSEVLTPNHQVYTQTYHVKGRGRTRKTWYSYEWVPAGSLTEGTSVVSNYQYRDGCNGFSRDRIRNSCNGKLMHRFIYEELVGDIPDGYVIHHKDLDKSNNDLSNLEMMTSSEHKALHARLNNPRPDWTGDTNPFYGCHHTEDSIVKMCNSKGVKRITISDILPYKDLPYEEIANILGCSRDTVKRRMQDAGIWDSHTPNHKVVSVEYLEETYDVYNMEVEDCEDYFIGGSEGILVHNCYRLASIDKKDYPDIYTQGPDDAPYYTNSCHLPVKEVSTMKDLFDNQDELQCKFTGGTVVHLYCGGPMSGTQAKHIIRTICTNYSLPYVSISPVVTLCEEHGQLPTKSDTCPKCGRPTSQLQRITGYIRDTRYWNPGKKSEYSDRKQFQDFVI